MTILSDRGRALLSAIKKYYKLAFKKPCAQHIVNNLKTNGFTTTELISSYWEAALAPTKHKYNKAMIKMRILPKGNY